MFFPCYSTQLLFLVYNYEAYYLPIKKSLKIVNAMYASLPAEFGILTSLTEVPLLLQHTQS